MMNEQRQHVKRVLLVAAATITLLISTRIAFSATAPVVITGGPSNATMHSVYLIGRASAGGTNASGYFRWSTDSSLANLNISSNFNLGNGVTTNRYSYFLTNLFESTRYYVQFVATNAITNAVYGSIDSFATGSSTYEFTGIGIQDMNIFLPDAWEIGRNIPFSIQETRVYLQSWVDQQHNRDGTHQNGFLTTAMVGDGQITIGKLAADVVSTFSSAAVSSVVITNATFYIGGVETPQTEVQCTTTERSLGTTTLPSNTYRHVEITCEVYFHNDTGNNVSFFGPRIKIGDQYVGEVGSTPWEQKVLHKGDHTLTTSVCTNGLQSASTVIDVRISADRTSATPNLTARLKRLKVEGIP